MTAVNLGYDKQYSWTEVATQHPPIMSLFGKHDPRYARLNDRLKLCEATSSHLYAMDEFDRRHVANELLVIIANPKDPQAHQSRFNPLLWLRRVRYHFHRYHYSIEYYVLDDNRVLVTRLWFDEDMTGTQDNVHRERHLLYVVNRTGDARFSSDFRSLGSGSDEVVGKLRQSWGLAQPSDRIETRFAAVNGMKNDLQKASWLMGVHLDVDRPHDEFDQYTLFHNPTHGTFLDLWGCAWDKNPVKRGVMSTDNSHHLAEALYTAQMRGEKIHWVVHSRGAIVFTRAVKLAMTRHGVKLACHTVSLHAIGSHLADTWKACSKAGINIEGGNDIKSRFHNPYDLVPNLAGRNDMSGSGLARSLMFIFRAFGNDALASPHTLPFLGMDTYINQLNFSGHHKLAKLAAKYRPKD